VSPRSRLTLRHGKLAACLRAVDAGIQTAAGQKLGMRALFLDPPSLQDYDLVRLRKRRQPLGTQEDGQTFLSWPAWPESVPQSGDDPGFRLHVDRREGVIEYQQAGTGGGVGGDGARQTNSLALTSRDADPQFADLSLHSRCEPIDVGIQRRYADRSLEANLATSVLESSWLLL
jgi:hypothetical protein